MPIEREHRPDCQLLTVPTYGLCTCDFDERMKARDPSPGGTGQTTLQKRPVAFRVKDYADGWILFHDEEAAYCEAEAMGGALMQGLYVRDGTPITPSIGPRGDEAELVKDIRAHLGHMWSNRTYVQSEKMRDIMRRAADALEHHLSAPERKETIPPRRVKL